MSETDPGRFYGTAVLLEVFVGLQGSPPSTFIVGPPLLLFFTLGIDYHARSGVLFSSFYYAYDRVGTDRMRSTFVKGTVT